MADTDYRNGFPTVDHVRNHLYRNHSDLWMVFSTGEPLFADMLPRVISLSVKLGSDCVYVATLGKLRDVFIESAIRMRPLMADGRECCWSSLDGAPTDAERTAFCAWVEKEQQRLRP